MGPAMKPASELASAKVDQGSVEAEQAISQHQLAAGSGRDVELLSIFLGLRLNSA